MFLSLGHAVANGKERMEGWDWHEDVWCSRPTRNFKSAGSNLYADWRAVMRRFSPGVDNHHGSVSSRNRGTAVYCPVDCFLADPRLDLPLTYLHQSPVIKRLLARLEGACRGEVRSSTYTCVDTRLSACITFIWSLSQSLGQLGRKVLYDPLTFFLH